MDRLLGSPAEPPIPGFDGALDPLDPLDRDAAAINKADAAASGLDFPNIDTDRVAAMYRLMGDRTRLAILRLLARREVNVSALCATLRLPQPTVSHHLGLLRMNRLISNRRDGKQIYYSLNPQVCVLDPMSLTVNCDGFSVRLAAN